MIPHHIIIYTIFIYIILGFYYVYLDIELPDIYFGIMIFFSFKWIINYRSCTISRIECLIRGVKKENGYIYSILNDIVDIRYSPYIFIIIPLCFILFIYNIFIKNKRLY